MTGVLGGLYKMCLTEIVQLPESFKLFDCQTDTMRKQWRCLYVFSYITI